MAELALTHLILLKKDILILTFFFFPSSSWNTILQYGTKTVFKTLAFLIKKLQFWEPLPLTYLCHGQCDLQWNMDNKKF